MRRTVGHGTMEDQRASSRADGEASPNNQQKPPLKAILWTIAAAAVLSFTLPMTTAERDVIHTELRLADIEIRAEDIIQSEGWDGSNLLLSSAPHTSISTLQSTYEVRGADYENEGSIIFYITHLDDRVFAVAHEFNLQGQTGERQVQSSRLMADSINKAGIEFHIENRPPHEDYSLIIENQQMLLREHFWAAWARQF